MRDSLNLTNRVGIVTGASRGIGLAIAQRFAEHGMDLVLNARSNSALLEDQALAITETYGVKVQTYVGDVADPLTATSLAKLAFSAHRKVDVWVNNAGNLIGGLLGMVTPADIENTLGTNLVGVLHGTQQAARLMSRGGGGSIINMTSIIGRFGHAGQTAYAASKAGVIGATYSAAKELAPKNIRVNAVAPGFIDTDMVADLHTDGSGDRTDAIGMGRIGTPEEVADCVLFLASEMSRCVTGQVIGVDGGMAV
jgi:3-oxoacyl-[acyl-carrier protein] reductase